MHTKRLFLGFLLLICTTIGITTLTANPRTNAQESLPVTIEPTLQAQLEATSQARIAEWEKTYKVRPIEALNSAYLIAADATVNPLIAAETLETQFGTRAVHSWDDFLALNDEKPFEAVFIHVSMADQVDSEWLSHAYRNEVFITGFNLREKQLAALIGDHCRKLPEQELLDFGDSDTAIHFIYSPKIHAIVDGEISVEVAQGATRDTIKAHLDEVELETCGKVDQKITEGYSIGFNTGVWRGRIITSDDIIKMMQQMTLIVPIEAD